MRKAFCDILRRQSKLAKKRNDRDLVIGVEHAVVNKRILLLALIRAHGEAALFIVGRCEIIRLGRGKAAAGALHLADVVIANIFILKLSAAIGACAHIVYYIDALVPVGRQAAQGEVAALVVLFKPAAYRVVGIEDHVRIVRQSGINKREYKLRMRVALDRVAEQVRAHGVVGVNVFVYPQ